MLYAVISKATAAALAAMIAWGAASIWDNTSTKHNLAAGCLENNPNSPHEYGQEALVGIGLALVLPKKWKGPAVAIWFGTNAGIHANAAVHNQSIRPGC